MPQLDGETRAEVKPVGAGDVVEGPVEVLTAPLATEDLVLPQPRPVAMTAAAGVQQPTWQVADQPRHKVMPVPLQSFEPVVRSPYTRQQQVFAPNAASQTQLFPAKQTAPLVKTTPLVQTAPLVVSPRLASVVHTQTTRGPRMQAVPAPLQTAHPFPVVPALGGQLASPCHGAYSVTSATPRSVASATPRSVASATPRTTPTGITFPTQLVSPASKEVAHRGLSQTRSPVAGTLSTRISL